jgi:uncharacterized protein YciI
MQMLAVRIAMSNPEKQAEREQYLDAHKRHLQETPLNIVLSGPVLDASGQQIGGMVVAEVGALEDLQKFSDDDPFIIHKIYADVIVCKWAATIDNR